MLSYMGKIVLYIALLLAVVKLDAQDERAKAFNNQLPISIGFSYGKHYSYRWLRDNPRYSLTNPNITDDVEFMNLRNQYEAAALTSSFSIRLDYILNDHFKVHTGLHFSSVGENVNTTSIGDADFRAYYQSHDPDKGPKKNRHSSFEIPFFLEVKLAPANRYNLGSNKINLPAFPRKLTAIVGMGYGNATTFGSPYDYYSDNSRNFLVRWYAGLGYVQALSQDLEFNIRALARYTYTTMHQFEPVNAYYYNFGGDIGFNYRLKKRNKVRPGMPVTKCFKCGDPVFEFKNWDWGFIYGANVNVLSGPDMSDNQRAMQLYKTWFDSTSLYPKMDDGDPSFYPIIGAHVGIHTEMMFMQNILGIMVDVIYTEKGFNLDNIHQINPGGNFDKFVSKMRMRFHYVDLPISLKLKPWPNLYFFGGASFAGKVSERNTAVMYMYKDEPQLMNFDYHRKEFDFNRYFESVAKIMVFNHHYGIGYIFNENLDAMIRVQKSASFVEEQDYQQWTAMFSLFYNVGKRHNW